MGAWAHGSFQNDEAMDWVVELQHARNAKPVSQAIRNVLAGYLDAHSASIGLAAAEVVAAVMGAQGKHLPEAVIEWTADPPPFCPELFEMACRAVERILNDSELKDLWAESKDGSLWQAEVQGLLDRLSGLD